MAVTSPSHSATSATPITNKKGEQEMTVYPTLALTGSSTQANQNPLKYLLFVDGGDDAALFPVHRLQSITCAANATVICKFSPGSLGPGQAASIDIATLTITADTERAVMIALGEAIGGYSAKGTNDSAYSNVIEVCNDVTSTFLHANILSCTITLDA